MATGELSPTVAPATPAETSPETGPALLRPLRIRDFRLLFTGETISVLGDQFHFIALTWLALQLTGSGLVLGTVLMTAAIPRAAFMLLGGAFSDRFSPRTLMLLSNVIRGIAVGILAALVLSGRAELWHLYVLAGIFGIVDAFFYPAMNTIVPMLVPERQLAPANAVVQSSMQVMGLIGPAVAGAFIAIVGTGPAFVIDAASFAVAAFAIALIAGGRRSAQPSAEKPPSMLQTIAEGLRAAWADRTIRSMVVLIAAFNFAFTGPMSVGLAVLADQQFAGGSAAFGLLLSAFGGGALIGAVVSGSVPRLPRLGTIFMVIAISLGIGLALIGLAPNLPGRACDHRRHGRPRRLHQRPGHRVAPDEDPRGAARANHEPGDARFGRPRARLAGDRRRARGHRGRDADVRRGRRDRRGRGDRRDRLGRAVAGRLAERGACRLGLGWLEASLDGIGEGSAYPASISQTNATENVRIGAISTVDARSTRPATIARPATRRGSSSTTRNARRSRARIGTASRAGSSRIGQATTATAHSTAIP